MLERYRNHFIGRRFAALNYRGTGNIGDEIQTVSALRFIPRVDAWVDRERLDEFARWRTHKIILNGWFLHSPYHWPPSSTLDPLFISFHLTRETVSLQNPNGISPSSTVLSAEGIQYLRHHQPIGARDIETLERLRAVGIEAYFSGCLTLTLEPQEIVRQRHGVVAVDVSDRIFEHISRHHYRPIARLTHVDNETIGAARFDKARGLLRCYASARAVVTSRLHCALPCLALGTPVLLVETAPDAYRFSGLRELLRTASEDQVLRDQHDFDLNVPPPNKDSHQGLRDRMIETCTRFVG